MAEPPPPYPQPYQGYPPPYYPAPPPPRPTFPYDRSLAYHQLLRTWNYAWWRSVIGAVIVFAGFIVIVPVIALPILVIGAATEAGDFLTNIEELATFEEVTPASMLYLNATLGGAILVMWLVVRLLHGLKPRWLASVTPRLRWNFLMACLGVSVLALIASIVVGGFIPASPGDPELGGDVNDFTPTAAWIALIVLLTTPFQAAGEEYVFRGYLLQAIGSFVHRGWWKWVAITVTALLFALAHGFQNPPLFFDRFMFGFIAGWLTIRTGGLEAGIALHVLNNYVAFGFALAFGDLAESLSISEVSWWNIAATLTQSSVYVVLVLWLARKFKLRTQSPAPPVQVA